MEPLEMSTCLKDLPPYSYTSKEEYSHKLQTLKETQERLYQERVQKNKEYALKRVMELTAEYKKTELDTQMKEKQAAMTNQLYVSGDPQFFVVILIRSMIRMPAKLKKICELFRLKKINTLVMVRNNESNRRMLQKLRNFVAYGFIDINLLRTLVYKRGLGRIDNKAVNLTNENIEDAFDGELRCIEELIYHLHYGTEYFKVVNNFLMPFGLNCPKGGFRGKKNRDYVEGGCAGNWYSEIGTLVKRMVD
ncbi:60S ribosomal protein L7 [Trachipleistophora hominis]|uniref:60S ribosomal protein L7 n=1 Tax=Trachipleistophora hominis TaxID=72359 RepID=L7JWT0_TRAHO|nr:60S ribosomal protein L7 [Trachipleistophora hominis]